MECVFIWKFLKIGKRCIFFFVYFFMRLKINFFFYVEKKGFWKEEMGYGCGFINRKWLGWERGFLFFIYKVEVCVYIFYFGYFWVDEFNVILFFFD